eukprot:12832005-Alexandrium_andersonii.AAC.1
MSHAEAQRASRWNRHVALPPRPTVHALRHRLFQTAMLSKPMQRPKVHRREAAGRAHEQAQNSLIPGPNSAEAGSPRG